MINPLRIALVVAVFVSNILAAEDGSSRKALVFHASFDRALEADVAKGDPKLYWAPKMEFPAKRQPGLPTNGVVTQRRGGGVRGVDDRYLRFEKKAPEMVYFAAKGNMPFNETNWSGTVSFWLRLSPDEDLAPGFADPIQITSKGWNNAAFFVEFSKDEKPREFRLGIYPDFEVWNPEKRDWNAIPMSEKPLAPVVRPPFSRDRWTHVAFTYENFNTGKPNGVATLYLNGEERAALKPRTQTFTWDFEKGMIMLGLSYVGDFDELRIYDRALGADEVKVIFEGKRNSI